MQDLFDLFTVEQQQLEGEDTLLAEPPPAPCAADAPAMAAGCGSFDAGQTVYTTHFPQQCTQADQFLVLPQQAQLVQMQLERVELAGDSTEPLHTAQQNTWSDVPNVSLDWLSFVDSYIATLSPSDLAAVDAEPLTSASLSSTATAAWELSPLPLAADSSVTAQSDCTTFDLSSALASGSESVPSAHELSSSDLEEPNSSPTHDTTTGRSGKPSRKCKPHDKPRRKRKPRDKPRPKRQAPVKTEPMHVLNPFITTVQQAWDEYWNGYQGAPSLRSLELKYGTTWCGGHGHARRKAFKRRMRFLALIEAVPEDERPAKIQEVQAHMGTRSLEWLTRELMTSLPP